MFTWKSLKSMPFQKFSYFKDFSNKNFVFLFRSREVPKTIIESNEISFQGFVLSLLLAFFNFQLYQNFFRLKLILQQSQKLYETRYNVNEFIFFLGFSKIIKASFEAESFNINHKIDMQLKFFLKQTTWIYMNVLLQSTHHRLLWIL